MIDCLAALQASDATSRYTANQADKEPVLSFGILSGRPEFGQKEFGNANRFRPQLRQASNKVLIHSRRDVKVRSFCRVHRLFLTRNVGLPFLTKEILKSVFHYFVPELPFRFPLKVSPFFSTEFRGTTNPAFCKYPCWSSSRHYQSRAVAVLPDKETASPTQKRNHSSF